MNKHKPSPYNVGGFLEFESELIRLVEKYGYSQVFIAYGEPNDKVNCTWRAFSNVISQGMVDYIEECIEHGRNRLDGTTQ